MTRRFSTVAFSSVFALAYLVALAFDGALFRYYPLTGQFTWGHVSLPDAGPAMAWYGLLATAALVALPVALLLPQAPLAARLRNLLWVLPAVALLGSAWLMRVLLLR